ncbi:MAG TPA: kelch repeat-containing protein [Sandaracinaceae bacterium LLY-WYZ-13_1]|nr:kelch repeat-containing protein [Sandaracinaceae bacterium LLY-WYZ-13_1]
MNTLTKNPWPLLVALALGCGGPSTPAPATPASDDEPTAATTPPPPPVEDDGSVEVAGALLPPMPVAVTSFGAASDGEHLWVLGGYHGTPHEYSREGQSRSLWKLPLSGEGGWERAASLEGGLQGLALVHHGGRLCRFGGNRIHNPEGEPADMRSVGEAGCFDPDADAWTALPSLPAGRSSHEAAVIGDTVYVAGGWRLGEGGPTEATWHQDVLSLDLSADDASWQSVEAPFTRRAVGVANAGDALVVIGGLTPEREVSRRVDVLDPASGEWTRGPDFPSDAFGAAAVGVGDAVYASARDGVVYRWRPGTDDAWETASTLAFPRFFHQLVPAGDGLVAVGGIGGMHTNGRTRHVERVPLGGDEPTIARWTMDYPGEAKNRQAFFVHEGFVYLFGGNRSLEQHDFAPESFLSAGWRLHLPSMRWEEIADYPARRQTMQTVVVDGRGISVGGFGHDGTAAVTHPESFAYDFERGEWSERGGLPRGRTQFGLTHHGDRLWAFGGLNYDPSRGGEAAFEHVTNTLATPAGDLDGAFEAADVELPGPRRAFAGAAMDGRYYIVGGMREGFELVDGCLAYDFEADDFDEIACPRQLRLSAHLIPLNGTLYLVGGSVRGEDGMETDGSIEAYDPEADAWRVVLEDLPFETKHMHVGTFRDRILIVSTHREEPRALVALVDPR